MPQSKLRTPEDMQVHPLAPPRVTPRPEHSRYPPLEPYQQGQLPVDSLHRIYWEQSGNPQGKPALFVHGGPGSGTQPDDRRWWDPNAYRIVLFDQRGCGQSSPHASLERNTTWHLVEDIERLRSHLGIERWQLFGGSWGSTLSLAYAERYPSRVTELVLWGIFLFRQKELHWFSQNGASRMYPDAWARLIAAVPEAEHHDLIGALYRRLTHADEAVRLAAAEAWTAWGSMTCIPQGDSGLKQKPSNPRSAEARARITHHYQVHRGFFESDDQLLTDIGRMRDVPGVIVQGRHDVVCPLESAWELHRVWPRGELQVVPHAGHSPLEPGILDRLVAATDRFRRSTRPG